ncbi:MAG: alpha/beta hydrolase, partial [Amylibacter sp.]
MSKPAIFESKSGRKIAYHKTNGTGPGVVFLGGFKSDMDGTKATYLESWARDKGRAFLRFDYSGHGQSSDRFEDG